MIQLIDKRFVAKLGTCKIKDKEREGVVCAKTFLEIEEKEPSTILTLSEPMYGIYDKKKFDRPVI